jgi:hypothetical protein
MRRFMLMLTLATIMTAVMGVSALPARAEVTDGSCDYSVSDDCGGGGDFSAFPIPQTPYECYEDCMSDGDAILDGSSYDGDGSGDSNFCEVSCGYYPVGPIVVTPDGAGSPH